MRKFEQILDMAAQHHDGRENVLAKAANSHLAGDLTTISERLPRRDDARRVQCWFQLAGHHQ